MSHLLRIAEDVRELAGLLPDSFIDHEGDCCGTLCAGCGHCCHSIAPCDHNCGAGHGGGCKDALDTPEVTFRRQIIELLDLLGL